MIKNLEKYPIVKESQYTKDDLIKFERLIADHWEAGKIKGPVHLSGGNEEELIEIGKRIKSTDWLFSTWRSHYHALIKGINPKWLEEEILAGRSITIVSKEDRFYSSAIVGAIIPIATGVAMANKRDNKDDKVFCFIGDMAFETGGFYEMHKYAERYDLPIIFIVEDNGVSTNTPTEATWNDVKRDIPNDVIWYSYEKQWPHYGTGKWVIF
jgi:TPP-dependent pyruvate/acetoin dehydrogenase alpha subunit